MSSRTPWSQHDAQLKETITNALTTHQHNVLVLWLAGCTISRISIMLNIKPRTTRTHLKRARHTYDAILEKETR